MGHDLFRSIANDYSCDLDGDYENDLSPRQAFGQEGRSFTVLFCVLSWFQLEIVKKFETIEEEYTEKRDASFVFSI